VDRSYQTDKNHIGDGCGDYRRSITFGITLSGA
jgi:hypothetical protein